MLSKPQDLAGWLRHLETLHPNTIELGLARVNQVAERLRLDFGHARVITVGGTNGKGSCVAMCEAICRAAGYRTAALAPSAAANVKVCCAAKIKP
jgi:dihydrofolate synthase/folylpolyglutamate synthase